MKSVTQLDPKKSLVTSRLGSLVQSRLLNRKALWIWPLLAIPIMGVMGYFIFSAVEGAIRENAAAQLTAVLNADVEALRIWMNFQESTIQSAAKDPQIAALSTQLTELANSPGVERAKWVDAPQQSELAQEIAPHLQARDYLGYMLADPQMRIVSSSYPELLGQNQTLPDPSYLEKLAAGQAVVTRPVPSRVLLDDIDGEKRAGVPTMFAMAPIRSGKGKLLGILAFRIRPDLDFTRILGIGRFGITGETYAFDKEARCLSQTRFDKELKQQGLIPDNKHTTSILTFELRDPGVNLTTGARAVAARSELPLTYLAAEATAGRDGVNAIGYRDYLGVPTIGAWKWLPEYGLGVATEIDAAEAYHAANIVRRVHWGMFGLLCLLSLGIFGFTIAMARLQRQARLASVEAKRVGQYQLNEKLGSGGMGVVYKGHHAMLRRPTAVKLLDPERTTEESIGRFEREVRLTSLLNHPNTITVYDFGRTDEGVFYYAMELLEGIDLEALVRMYGPQSPGRVIHLLKQVCGSLAEAHGTGLIHRDIKPGNIMLTQRGGICDFVKVLDFGLVKAISTQKEAALTMANTLTGTPLYMSPEAIERSDHVDARSDLYAVGAVGYFLLTGEPVFNGNSVVEICMAQIKQIPARPSERLRRAVSPELEDVLLSCLAKRPEDRPQTAKELAKRLSQIVLEAPWSEDDASAWWSGFARPELLETREVSTNRTPMDTQVLPK